MAEALDLSLTAAETDGSQDNAELLRKMSRQKLALEAIISGQPYGPPRITFEGRGMCGDEVREDVLHDSWLEGEALEAAVRVLKRDAEVSLARLRRNALSLGIDLDA